MCTLISCLTCCVLGLLLVTAGCCCAEATECELCDGTIPDDMSLSITDFDGTGCCTALNGTFVLTRIPGECQWSLVAQSVCTGLDADFLLTLTDDGMGNVVLTLYITAYNTPASPEWEGIWSKAYAGSSIDCSALEGELLEFDSWTENSTFYGDCDETAAQLALSAA